MIQDKVLSEAKRLYDLGFAIHLLHKKSKRPIESGWTTGPRKSWAAIEANYRPGMNIGVRLGSASKIRDGFLGVIDLDVKSKDARHAKEALSRMIGLTKGLTLPEVISGRGNGSRHIYIITPSPITPYKAAQSAEVVKVVMPSVMPSKRELAMLRPEEVAAGIRLRPAWEVSIMGEGQQVVLPPSIHPDSGRAYVWSKPFDSETASKINLDLLKKSDNAAPPAEKEKPGPKGLEDFEPVLVELSWVPIDDKIRAMIVSGEGAEDRSAMLMPVTKALTKAGLSRNEILSVLTDRSLYMGRCAYDHAKTSDRMRAANWLFRYSVKRAFDESSAEGFFASPIVEPKEQSLEKIEEDQEAFDTEFDWTNDLTQTKAGNIQPTLRNVVMIIENEICEGLLRRDLFSARSFFAFDAPWGSKENTAISDDDISKAKMWLSNNFGFEPPSKLISEALEFIAYQNSFDPVVNWLRGLPAWDGQVRLDTWLKKHFEAEGDDDYLAQVFRKWIFAMVARALRPGMKFDWMPIFEGRQGVGKSSFGRLLAGDKYFLDSLPDLANKDAVLGLRGTWVVEFGELASFRKNEIEIVKSFLTRTIDRVRPPYGEHWLEIERRCVFFGTTNHETYLRDDTGNRRFKPVKVGNLDFEALERDREQLFAEALWLYDTGFETPKTLEIAGRAKIYEASIQGAKMAPDDSTAMAEEILDFMEKEKLKDEAERFNFERFKMADLFGGGSAFEKHLPLKNWRYDGRTAQFAGKALKYLKGEKTEIEGRNYWKLPFRR